jgi:hypothetical protein
VGVSRGSLVLLELVPAAFEASLSADRSADRI